MPAHKNIFILYMPPTNPEAMRHFLDTVERGVAPAEVARFLPEPTVARLEHVFGRRPLTIWGSRDTRANRAKFDRMRPGDDILIVVGGHIRFLGFVAEKLISPQLSERIWANILQNNAEGWDLIYFIANPVEINVPWAQFCRLVGYRENYQLRGFTRVSDELLERFYARYDSAYEMLLRLNRHQPIQERLEIPETEDRPGVTETSEQEEPPPSSRHVEMQWKLSQLGIKAGSRIWVPTNDRSRITNEFQFNDFEERFTAGLDIDAKYVENIDVVWKDQYRIDAAFEVEHSTSIYSGLLRFSDLKIVAPNSTYPLFIVADAGRRQRLLEQLRRPTFRKSEIREAVRFLPYDAVDELWSEFCRNGDAMPPERVREAAEDLSG